MLADTLSVSAETPPGMTYRNYPEWEMLPKVLDYEDEQINDRIQKLVDEGEACNEAMLAIVRECDDWMVASSALAILSETSGDKRDVVAALKVFFSERLPHAKGEEEWLMTNIAQFVVAFGTEEDVSVLFPMLTHPELRVRYLGARYLGQRGGQQALDALEQAKSRESNNLVLDEMDKAVASIRGRLAGQDAETPPAP